MDRNMPERYQNKPALLKVSQEAADMGWSREAVLRRLYVIGAIKIEIFGKVLWNPQNDMPSR